MKLLEILAKDYLPKQYQAFIAKYRTMELLNLYVNFNNHVDNTLDKTFNETPQQASDLLPSGVHQDPVGLYAYPASWVVNPGSSRHLYGTTFKYLRVVQDRSKNKLNLTNLSIKDLEPILQPLYGDRTKDVIDHARTILRIRQRKVRAGTLFLAAIQFGGSLGEDPNHVTEASSKEQTATLRKLGYDAIEDTAQSGNDASLSKYEPSQILFLTRSSFSVVEVFVLHEDEVEYDDMFKSSIFTSRRLVKKAVSLFAQATGININPATIQYYAPRGERQAEVTTSDGRYTIWLMLINKGKPSATDDPYDVTNQTIQIRVRDHEMTVPVEQALVANNATSQKELDRLRDFAPVNMNMLEYTPKPGDLESVVQALAIKFKTWSRETAATRIAKATKIWAERNQY